MEPNTEQREIIRASRNRQNRRLVVDALAGTGKTSTLVQVAEANPYVQFLYIAYNTAAKEDAMARFPRNVECKTTHGMVFMAYGKRNSARLNAGRVPSWKAAAVLGLRDVRVEYCVSCEQPVERGDGSHAGHAVMAETLSSKAAASLATRTVDRFCYSADPEIVARHVPFVQGLDERLMPAVREAILPVARNAWADLTGAHGQLAFTHDMYLKLAQLDGWRPRKHTMLDEAQDTNPCVADMVLDTKMNLMVVGDPNQAIYEWRGATDAMAQVTATERLSLTGSYRFGPAVAEEANLWLEMLETPLRLRGWKKRNSTVVQDVEGEPDAILCRSNAGAIVSAMGELERGKKVAIVGGGAAIEKLAKAAEDLIAGRKTDHPDLLAFEDWAGVQRYCKEEPQDAGTLVPLVKAVDTHGTQAILNMTRMLVDERRQQPDVTVSTAHKAKGRQWTKVQIGGDFPQPKEDGGTLGKEELRLAYVAITRGMEQVGRGSLSWIHN